MSTTTTPKSLNDLKFQDWVIDVLPQHSPQDAAERVLNELFPEDERPVQVNFLFSEMDGDDEVKVYEAYKDSGSVDYIYLKKHFN